MTESDEQSAIAEAFQKWTSACNALSFTQTTDSSNPDFKIRSDFTLFFSPENQLIKHFASLYQVNRLVVNIYSKVTYLFLFNGDRIPIFLLGFWRDCKKQKKLGTSVVMRAISCSV